MERLITFGVKLPFLFILPDQLLPTDVGDYKLCDGYRVEC